MTDEVEYTSKLCHLRKYARNLGSFGLEIETESKNPYNLGLSNYWSTHSDGSLRDFGVEFIFKKPLDIDSNEYKNALKEFEDWTKLIKFENSTYTSVHVHLNFVEKDLTHLANFIVLYVLLDNVLTRYCGADRDGNLFCLKSENAEASVMLYRELFGYLSGDYQFKTVSTWVGNLNQNVYKYSSLNIVPLKNLGSVEVRTHPGTTDVKVIDRWVHILNCLYTAAQRYRDPREIMAQLRDRRTYIGFVKHIFGNYAQYFDEKTIDEDIGRNLFYAKYLVYGIKDWSKFGKIELPFRKFKERTVMGSVFVDAGMDQLLRDELYYESYLTGDV